MHPAEIQAALKVRGYSQAAVARDCGVERTTVGAVVNGRSRSQQIENRIAELTGLPLDRLWPQWHGDHQARGMSFTEEERRIVERYRLLSEPRKIELMEFLQGLFEGRPTGRNIASGSRSVVATDNARVAQGDYHEAPASKRKR